MTNRGVLSIAVKVLGLVFLAHAIANVPRTISFAMMLMGGRIVRTEEPWIATLEVASLILSFAIAAALLGSADGIARRLVRDDADVPLPGTEGRRRALFGVAARVLGLVLVVQAIPALLETFASSALKVRIVSEAWGREMLGASVGKAWAEQWAAIIRWGASLAIGAYLLLGAAKLASVLYREPELETPGEEQDLR